MRASRLILLFAFAAAPDAFAQPQPGHPIGTVSVRDKLILLELDTGVIAPEHLFDLDHRTVRFVPDGAGYRVETVKAAWDTALGTPLAANQVALHDFRFPFSGRTWDTLSVQTGTITFGAPTARTRNARGGGFYVDRFAELRVAAGTLLNQLPGIAAFLKPRMTGPRYVSERPDRVVVTWLLTEPSGGIFDFTWTPTENRIQAALHKDGTIELTYDGVAARDAIVGVYPMVNGGVETPLITFPGRDGPPVRLSTVDGVFLQAAIDRNGLIAGDSSTRRTWHITFGPRDAGTTWTVRAIPNFRDPSAPPRFVASGPGVSPNVVVDGDTVTLRGTLPASLAGARRVPVSIQTMDERSANGVTSSGTSGTGAYVSLAALRPAEIDLSSATKSAGPFPVAFESFHYAALPRPTDMACSVIKSLGDRFDFFVWYSDFRVDNQEAGTPSTGPRGGNVTGIGETMRGLQNYCSQGRVQWMFVQPVYIGAAQGQERSPDGRMTGYDYAMSQVGHELGHRWTADAKATVNGETFDLGPVHWARGLEAPAAFPYTRPVEASAMGGGAWQENADGTFTQLDDDFFVPATGYSWLDLYLMGLAKPEEVPPFFILRDLVNTGTRDAAGHPIYRGRKTPVTIADVVAANGPRLPAFDQAQKQFNTGVVMVVQHGQQPSAGLVSRANDIRERWMQYWTKVTGGRATMTTDPR